MNLENSITLEKLYISFKNIGLYNKLECLEVSASLARVTVTPLWNFQFSQKQITNKANK